MMKAGRSSRRVVLSRRSCQLAWEGNTFPYKRIIRSGLTLLFKTSIVATFLADLTSCAFLSHHHFTGPARDWQSRNGQLMYRAGRTTVIGEVLVRFSKAGQFELTFSKGPGVNLFTIEQDATFAQVKSSLTHLSWSGPTDHAPKQLRGWLSLREKLIAAPNDRVVRHIAGDETFVFRF
jgi:hypothetical protein